MSTGMAAKWISPFIVIAATIAFFGGSVRFEFINYDDPYYVISNTHINGGLTSEGLAWACANTGETNLWHPLTWLSHMVDVELFGLQNPGAHHLVNVAWHALATVGFLLVLRRLTGHEKLALALALMWALHPQRMQSVAWISERKDVLSGALFFLSWWAWERWRAREGSRWYIAALALFFLAALSKPNVVPLPFLLAWREWTRSPGSWKIPYRHLFTALLPFVGIALAVAGLTIYFQQMGNLAGLGDSTMSPARRFALMPSSLWWYLSQWLAPTSSKLWVYPPLDNLGRLLWASLGLALTAAAIIPLARRSPLVRFGAGACLLMWLPVSGLVPVSFYYVADRYSYLIQPGLFILAAGALSMLPARFARRAPAVIAILVAGFAIVAWQRLGLWKNSTLLFTHERSVNPRSLLAPIQLGAEKEKRKDYEAALKLYFEALTIDSGSGLAATNAGRMLAQLGRTDEAIAQWREAGAKPVLHRPDPFLLAAAAAAKAGRLGQVREFLDEGLERFPDSAPLMLNHAALAHRELRPADALIWYDRILAIEPLHGDALQGKGAALIELGRRREGLDILKTLLTREPHRTAVRTLLESAQGRQ